MIAFNAFGHMVVGLILAMLLASEPIHILFILLGSLLPDIDHPRSTLGKYNIFNRGKLMKHRGHCHSFLGALVLSVPFYVLGGTQTFLFVLIGAVGHLLADKLASFLPRHQKFNLRLW